MKHWVDAMAQGALLNVPVRFASTTSLTFRVVSTFHLWQLGLLSAHISEITARHGYKSASSNSVIADEVPGFELSPQAHLCIAQIVSVTIQALKSACSG
jgi:hypothetical protein